MQVGPERFRAPEILFDPEIIGLEYPGVHQMVVDAIARTDLDLRKALYANIVLSGGTTMTRGFGDRLIHELQKLAVKDMRIKIFAPPERKYSTWDREAASWPGSAPSARSVAHLRVHVLLPPQSLANTKMQMWVSIDDWHENPDIIHTKFN